MALFKGRSSLLEVQNRALIKTAKERAAQIETLERELQNLQKRTETLERAQQSLQGPPTQIEKLERALQSLQERTEQTDNLERELETIQQEVERLTLERDFYYKRAVALEEENRELTESATKYSVHAQKLERG